MLLRMGRYTLKLSNGVKGLRGKEVSLVLMHIMASFVFVSVAASAFCVRRYWATFGSARSYNLDTTRAGTIGVRKRVLGVPW